MSETIQLAAEARVAGGSNEARRVRRDGKIPAAITRLTKETTTFQLDAHDYMMATREETGDQFLVTLTLEGVTINALLREIQRDVMTGEPIHIDFSEVDLTKKIRATVRIRLEGEPDGVRNGGGILTQIRHEITVECLPADLIEVFNLDVTELKLSETITVADLKLGEKYTILTSADKPVASVAAAEEDKTAADAPAADAKADAKGDAKKK